MDWPKALADGDRAIAAFVASELGCEVTRVVRVAAFVTNAVYEVDAGKRRIVVKASRMHDALRAEAWACARAADAGLAAPTIFARGRLGADGDISAFITNRVAGSPVAAGDPVLRDVGVDLRRLHDVKLPGFGSLAEAAWDARGDFSLVHRSWLDYLTGIVRDARALTASVADAAAAAIDAHAGALAAVRVGSLCHGDLKPAHILVDRGRLAGVIDWGDAVVGDPLWDVARFAHRVDAASVSRLLEGYGAERSMVDELAWRAPLYGALWMLVDAIVDSRLGGRVEAPLAAAMRLLGQPAR